MIFDECISEKEVFDYWHFCKNSLRRLPLRTDIINDKFPRDAEWYNAQIEEHDIEKMFLISVEDFRELSQGTWTLPASCEKYSTDYYDKNHTPRFESLKEINDTFDTRLILVSDSASGPFTIIDGNHRAILLLQEQRLVGTNVFLGVHPKFREFDHAGMTYRNKST